MGTNYKRKTPAQRAEEKSRDLKNALLKVLWQRKHKSVDRERVRAVLDEVAAVWHPRSRGLEDVPVSAELGYYSRRMKRTVQMMRTMAHQERRDAHRASDLRAGAMDACADALWMELIRVEGCIGRNNSWPVVDISPLDETSAQITQRRKHDEWLDAMQSAREASG